MAAERGIRVYTVGGVRPTARSGGRRLVDARALDEETLKTIANLTGGEYFYAGTAVDLKKIYQSLNRASCGKKKETEITRFSPPRRHSRSAVGAAVAPVVQPDL